MTTQYAVLPGRSGRTLTAKLFTLAAPDTVAFTADSVTERTNAKGEYLCTFGEASAISGDHKLVLFYGTLAAAIGFVTFAGTDTETATETPPTVELDSTYLFDDGFGRKAVKANVTHYQDTLQGNGDLPAKLDAIRTNTNSDIPASISDVQTDVDAANNYLSALSAVFSGITSLANWLRRGFRKDAGTAGMTTAQTEINNTGGSFAGTTDSLEAIRDNQASSGGASLEDIIAGVQSVSGAIVAAQDTAAFSIRIGDTWTQDIESLGDMTDKTVCFALKKRASDADTAAIVFIVEGTGLTKLNGANTTAGWGSIEILDEVAGDIRLRLESDATSLLTSGSYVDAVKLLEDGDDRSPRNAGRTVVSAGVIADIT